MKNSGIEFRHTQRRCYCRGCDRQIERYSQKVISFYSFRNRGQWIYICQACVDKMRWLIDNDQAEV